MAENNTLSEVESFARNLIAATADEPEAGRRALIYVVLNRREIAQQFFKAQSHSHPRFGDGSLADACRSVVRDLGYLRAVTVKPAQVQANSDYFRALATVCLVLSGDHADATHGAVDFHRHDELPQWACQRVPSALIGSWLFYPPN